MSAPKPIHLSLCLVPGHIHGLGLVDQLRYFRYQFRRLGLEVTCAKNRLRSDAINFVFGAHNGFDPALRKDFSCVFVNLEQLGQGAAPVSPEYLELLSSSAVVDYDGGNVAAYGRDIADVPLAPIQYAPYLRPDTLAPLADRPIDLLFFGCINERRQAWIDRVEATGRTVALFDSPLFGEERDAYIRMSKAVLNIHFYEACRFEQARVAHCLSLGTPVISERTVHTIVPPEFESSVLWVGEGDLEQFFREDFGTPECLQLLGAAVDGFRATDPLAAYADVIGFARGYDSVWREANPRRVCRPSRLNLQADGDYRPGWCNVAASASELPDLQLDLSRPMNFPLEGHSTFRGEVCLTEGSVDLIHAGRALAQCTDLGALMTNCLRLLRIGGEFHAEVPYGPSMQAWQDPTHARALNENTWVYFSAWFWKMGWVDARFEVVQSGYLDLELKATSVSAAQYMKVVLRKVPTTPQERMLAETTRTTLDLPSDEVIGRQVKAPVTGEMLPDAILAEDRRPTAAISLVADR